MKNQLLLNELHLSLTRLKKKLKESGMSYYEQDISRIEDVINQYPKLSKPPVGRLFTKKDEPGMLQTISVPIQALIKKLNDELKKEMTSLEKEMHGTEFFSDYELKRTNRYVARKELENELQKMLAMIISENKEFKEGSRIGLHLMSKE